MTDPSTGGEAAARSPRLEPETMVAAYEKAADEWCAQCWPGCGCDPYADKVIAALEESGQLAAARSALPQPELEALSVADTQSLLGADRPISIGKVPTDPIGMRAFAAIVRHRVRCSQELPAFWRCTACGCLWRDNRVFHDESVSLSSAKQTSCPECEMKPTAEVCEPLFRQPNAAALPRAPEPDSQALVTFCEQGKAKGYKRLDHLSPQHPGDDYERGRHTGRVQAFSEALEAVRAARAWADAVRASRGEARVPPEAFEKNGIRHGERVVCIDVPRLLGTVIRCATDGVDVRWDDGTLGELVWNDAVAYNAYRLQIARAVRAGQLEPTVCTEAEFQVQRANEERLTEVFNAGYEAGKRADRAGETVPPRCAWDEDEDGVWRTDCGHAWTFEDSGAPAAHKARFCFYCGLPITANTYATRVPPQETPE